MKNLLIISLMLFFTQSVFATCPIESNTACTIANMSNTLQSSVFQKSLRNSASETQNTQPAFSRDESILGKPIKTFSQKSNDYSYNSSCQFGVCSETGTPKLFGN